MVRRGPAGPIDSYARASSSSSQASWRPQRPLSPRRDRGSDDSYRFARSSQRQPSPPRRAMDEHRFSGSSYRPTSPQRREDDHSRSKGSSYRPGQNIEPPKGPKSKDARGRGRRPNNRDEFTFRSDRQMAFGAQAVPPVDKPRRFDRGQNRGNNFFRRTFLASERAFLQTKRETTPELLFGMDEGLAKFRALDELSEDDADSQSQGSNTGTPATDEADDLTSLPAKRRRLGHGEDAVISTAPKWSNPDPYTCLPPEESKRKGLDVVKLIRKAKVSDVKESRTANAVAENNDFISFSLDEDDISSSAKTQNKHSNTVATNDDFISLDFDKDDSSDRESYVQISHEENDTSRFRNEWTMVQTADSTAGLRLEDLAEIPTPVRSGTISTTDFHSWVQSKVHTVEPPQGADMIIPQGPSGAKGVSQPNKKRKRGGIVNGDIVPEWVAKNRAAAIPWTIHNHSDLSDTTFWLHKEVNDFYQYIKPTPGEDTVRQNLIYRLFDVLKRSYPESELRCFGSFASGLYLPIADMDLVLLSKRFLERRERIYGINSKWLHRCADILKRVPGLVLEGSMEVIAKARVPILKFVDRQTDIRVDISFENLTGIVANETFRKWKTEFPAMPPLVALLKQFVLMRNLNEVHTGGIGGFSIVCLVVSFLQQLPPGQPPEHRLGDILMDFLNFYGNKFDLATTGINMIPPYRFLKQTTFGKSKPDRLCIIDPNTPGNDISGGSSNIKLIFQKLAEAHELLNKRMVLLERSPPQARPAVSILGTILGGDYTSFKIQREILRRIYLASSGKQF